MKETILLINFNDTVRRNQVKRALMPLRLRLKSVGPDQYDLPVGVLAGEKQNDPQKESSPAEDRKVDLEEDRKEDLTEELFVMAGLSSGRVDAVLAALRKAGIRIPYKAVMTATNQDWDVRRLYREICSEHEAMTGKGRGRS